MKMKNEIKTSLTLLAMIIGIFVIASCCLVHAQGSIESEFMTFTNNPYCDADNGLYWWSSSGSSPTSDNCYEPVVEIGSSNSCCPFGEICDRDSDKCVPAETKIDYCSDYTQSECEQYTSLVAFADVNEKIAPLSCQASWYNDSDDCYYYFSCRCDWNSSLGICQSDYNFTKTCNTETDSLGRCVFTTIKNNCTGGYRLVEWTAFPEGGILPEGVKCENGSQRVKCLFSELSFFTTISAIILIVLIILFYVIYFKKSRKK